MISIKRKLKEIGIKIECDNEENKTKKQIEFG